jgi:penicillin-binding protein 1A
VGFDQPKTLGKNQTGGVVALPIWLGYMDKVLGEIPEMSRGQPDGVVTVPVLQYPAPPGDAKTIPEFFYREAVPPPEVLQPPPPPSIEPPPPALPAQPNPPT